MDNEQASAYHVVKTKSAHFSRSEHF